MIRRFLLLIFVLFTPSIVQCDLTNTDAQRFLFRHGLTINSFGFSDHKMDILPETNDSIKIVDITTLPENESEDLLMRAHSIHQQLRPHLPNNQQSYIDQIRKICRTGPAHMLVALSNDENRTILGLAVYRIFDNIKWFKHFYCDDIVTDETQRSLGVGRCLMNSMKRATRASGANPLTLDSGCQRARAHKFYYKEGFIIDQFTFALQF